ncbi:MAG: dTDP-4-dehydrorhamnose 3,5-epimerase [Flavobacteriales bacterium]
MKKVETGFEGLYVVEPRVFEDKRGYFFESYNRANFAKLGLDADFVQDNQSCSEKGVLRGLHFQKPPKAQAKLVSVTLGSVLDVVVDLRTASKTYGKHFKIKLSAENKTMLYIPEGFAHGFLSLEDQTIFAYKCSDVYAPNHEDALFWSDADLAIDWDLDGEPKVSEKDQIAPDFKTFKSPF